LHGYIEIKETVPFFFILYSVLVRLKKWEVAKTSNMFLRENLTTVVTLRNGSVV